MNPFRQILDDTASLVQDIRRGLKQLGWRFAWWSRRRQAERERQVSDKENLRRGIKVSSKMCPECRALIPAGASECPECGISTAHIRSGGIGRALATIFPYQVSGLMALMTSFFLLYLIAVLVSAAIPGPRGAPPPSLMEAIWSPASAALFLLGANQGLLSGGEEPWRLLTAVFLHGNLIHLGFNSYALRIVGPFVADLYGARKMFVVFVTTGIFGNVISLLVHGSDWRQVGASGAIFGFIGLAAVYGFRRRDAYGDALRRQMIQWAVYVLVIGLFLPADNAAHVGGMIGGALLGLVLPDPRIRKGPGSEKLWTALAVLCVLACIAAFAMTAYWAPAWHGYLMESM